jgi:autotransporter translocation and assembly factor TamB
MRKICLAAVVVVIILGLALTVMLLWTPLPNMLANRAVDRFLEPALGLEMEIEDVGGSLLRSLTIEGVQLRRGDGTRLAQVPMIALEYDWKDVVKRRWRLHRVVLREPVLSLQGYGQSDFAPPPDSTARLKLPAVVLPLGDLPDFEIESGRVVRGRILDGTGIVADSLILALSVKVEGKLARIEVPRAQVIMPRRNLHLRSSASGIVISSQDVSVERLEARTPMSGLSLSGRLVLAPSFSCSLEVQADSMSLGEVGRILSQDDVPTGRLQFSGRLQGDGHDWRGHLQAQGRVEEYHIDRLNAKFAWSQEQLALAQLVMQSPGVDLWGRGQLRLGGREAAFDADINLRDVDLHAILPQAPRTRLNGRLMAAGTGLDPQSLILNVRLDLDSATAAGYSFEKIRGQFQFQEGTLSTSRGLEIESQGAWLLVAGSLDPQRRLNAWAQLEIEDVGRLLSERTLSGALQARLQAQGSLEDPQVAGQVRLRDLRYGDRRVGRARGSFGLSGADSREEGFFALRFFQAQLSRLILDEGRARGRLQNRTLFVDSLSIEGPQGTVATTVQLDVMEDQLRFLVDRIQGQILRTAFQTVAPLEATYQQGRFHLHDARFSVGGGSLAAEAVIGPGSMVDGQIHGEQFQMELLSGLLPGEHHLSGLASVDVVAGGSLNAPQIEAGLVWRDGRFDQLEFQDIETQLNVIEDSLSIERLMIRRGETTLSGEGHLFVDVAQGRVHTDRSWALQIVGQGRELDVLPLMIEDIEKVEGPFTVELKASGTPRQPSYEGFFRLQDGLLMVASLGNEMRNINVRAYLDGQYVIIEEAQMETPIPERNLIKRLVAKIFGWKRRGRLEAHGRINLAGPAFDLSVTGRRFYIEYLPQEVEAEADLNIRLAGRQRPTIAGEITVRRALISRSMESAPGVTSPQGPPPYDVDLTVDIPKNCWLRNEAAEIEMQGQVRVMQQQGMLNLLGTMNTIQGSYYFYGHSFQIDRGEVTFDLPEKINPQLDISAWTQVNGERIDLVIGGRLESPNVTLTSSSGYGEGDIISLLTLHQTGAGLDTLGAQEVVAQQAESIFGGYLRQALNRKTGRFLGVETFKIQPDPEDRLNLSQAEVTVGTYLSSQFYVEYSRRLSQESGEQVGIEYSLSENLSLHGRRNMDGLYRLGLSARWQY